MNAIKLPSPNSSETATRDVFSKREAADFLRISARQLDYLVVNGSIPRIKLHTGRQGKVLFLLRDLLAYLENHRECAAGK